MPDRVDEVELLGPRLLAEQVDAVPGPRQRRAQAGVVDVGARPAQEVAVEDEDPHRPGTLVGCRAWPAARGIACARPPRAARSSIEAEPGRVYTDRETGEELEVVGNVLPLPPSESRLPWAVENLRFCTWCDQLAQRDLNDCPTCGRRMAPLAS